MSDNPGGTHVQSSIDKRSTEIMCCHPYSKKYMYFNRRNPAYPSLSLLPKPSTLKKTLRTRLLIYNSGDLKCNHREGVNFTQSKALK